MMEKIPLFNTDGSQNGEIEINPLVFDSHVNKRLLQLVLTAYAGNQHRGTHKTKERKEVSGGGAKPWRQKGTGRARQGSIRAPQWRGGGTVFGPRVRSYATRLPQQMKLKALISALSLRTQEKKLKLVEAMTVDQPKTKELLKIVRALHLDQGRTVCVTAEALNENQKRAMGNIKNWFMFKRVNELNAYHILRRSQLVIERNALPLIEKRVLSEKRIDEKEKVTA